jgi:hypothetical protein
LTSKPSLVSSDRVLFKDDITSDRVRAQIKASSSIHTQLTPIRRNSVTTTRINFVNTRGATLTPKGIAANWNSSP